MSGREYSKEELLEALELVRQYGNPFAAAKNCDIPRSTLDTRYKVALEREKAGLLKPFSVEELPSERVPTEELLQRRKRQFELKDRAKKARKLIPIRVQIPGPIGVVHMGDPHVDDDGTDLGLLELHTEIINQTEGMFGANLGDLHNNWIGRLARLWAEQSTSSAEAWQLVEWLVEKVDWLYLIAGNHDLWSGNGNPLDWMMKQREGVYEAHGARVELNFPNGKKVRINARHDFMGHSMFNPGHGPMKAVQYGWRDHILTCGHKHTSFQAGPLVDPATRLFSYTIRCAGYKRWDRYADEKGLPDQQAFAACATIIDPECEDDDTGLITVLPDIPKAAKFLTMLRKERGYGN